MPCRVKMLICYAGAPPLADAAYATYCRRLHVMPCRHAACRHLLMIDYMSCRCYFTKAAAAAGFHHAMPPRLLISLSTSLAAIDAFAALMIFSTPPLPLF